jgi:ribosomal peptide maturation radical SAM protein 1
LRSEIIPAWLTGWADEIARHDATLIGFTCMFDQTIASLAMARLVRERSSQKLLVLGGYAVRAPTAQMIIRSSPWIDAICDGEGEVTVVKLATAAAGEIPLSAVPGITFRSASGELVTTPPPPAVDLNANPAPNYDDYFADIRRLSEEHLVDVTASYLPIENSRGCWWGAKSHCVFCGIRNEDMAYRAMDSSRVLAVMGHLNERYGTNCFRFSDYIMPMQYFTMLLPELARRGRPYHLVAEMKANIREDQFVLLGQAGFVEVQLGIESFSSAVLRKMCKGVSAVQNVYDLVLGRRVGVRVLYNLLYGFPDDDLAEYERMAALLPSLIHLDPPISCVPVQITRFAPLQTHPGRFGIDEADPEPCYDLVFSRDFLEQTGFDISDYCYYFLRPFENSPRLQRIYESIEKFCRGWSEVAARGTARLYWVEDGDGLLIHDGRRKLEEVYRLGPHQSRILAQCERPTSLRALQDANPSISNVSGIVTELEGLGLLFRDEAKVVSIVLPTSEPQRNDPLSADIRNLGVPLGAGEQQLAIVRGPYELPIVDL